MLPSSSSASPTSATMRPVGRSAGAELLQPHIVLHDRGEQRHRDAQADRAGREIDVVDVLGARGIGLRAAEARGSARASRASGGRTDTGWRGTPARRAASPPRGPRASAPRNRAPSSPSPARRTTPGGRRPSARRGWAGGDWRGGSSRRESHSTLRSSSRSSRSALGSGASVVMATGIRPGRESPCVWTRFNRLYRVDLS